MSYKEYYNAAAVTEWAIAFIFTFYVLSFFIDLLPAVRSSASAKKRGYFGYGPNETRMQMEEQDMWANSARSGEVPAGTAIGDSQRTLGENNMRTVNGGKFDGQTTVASNF